MNYNQQKHHMSWQIVLIAVLSFAICIVASSLDTWMTFRSDTCFETTTVSNTIRGATIVFTGMSLLLPTLFFMYYASRVTNMSKKDVQIQVFVIGLVCNILTIICSSLGLWLANNVVHFSNQGEYHATKYTLISSIIAALVLPILFAVFMFHPKFIV